MRLLIILLCAFAASSCAEHFSQVSPCAVSADTVNYFAHVYPIINETCALPACHVNGFEHGNFKNAYEVQRAANNGTLKFMIDTRQMPPGITRGPSILTDCEVTIINIWIKNGALVE